MSKYRKRRQEMKYFQKLVGEKIYLSPVHEEDAEIMTKWMNDLHVTDYLSYSGTIISLDDQKKLVLKSSSDKEVVLAIVKKEDNTLVGRCNLFDINNIKRTATLGILIGEEEDRSKGYGTEAVKLLIDFGFHYLNLNNIMLTLLSVNERAKKTYEKVGFKEFGRRRQSTFLNGKYYDTIYMDILAKEFDQSHIQNKCIV